MIFVLSPQSRSSIQARIQSSPDGYVVRIGEATRSLDQNAKLWPMLTDISRQVDWYGQKLSEDDWKSVFTAGLKKAKVVPGLDGGFVVCGLSSSKMGKSEFSELIELILAFGAEHDVVWSEPMEVAG